MPDRHGLEQPPFLIINIKKGELLLLDRADRAVTYPTYYVNSHLRVNFENGCDMINSSRSRCYLAGDKIPVMHRLTINCYIYTVVCQIIGPSRWQPTVQLEAHSCGMPQYIFLLWLKIAHWAHWAHYVKVSPVFSSVQIVQFFAFYHGCLPYWRSIDIGTK